MNIQSILSEVNQSYAKHIYDTRSNLNKLMNQLDQYYDIIAYGLIQDHSGLYLEVIKLEEESVTC